ncbi:hypothetical protein [Thermococcus pacificus]|uniref:Uncharacterized protein n=1 Tax=Thermococcus pacificus TaxID=71998 RepID=A0A218P5V7_9EURY|nr:hypothetical protein [Thermococcus pacificus]ASJ06173.1 hypothetical protein A3L08_01925 [Thermococcus pacificus]
MKRYAVLFIAILLIGLVAGCLGRNSGETTPSGTTSSATQSITKKVETTTTTQTPKGPDLDELLKTVNSIRQFTYTSNATLRMLVTIEQGNTSETDNVTLNVLENGYMDYESWSAWINSTTVSLPDGAKTNMSRIVVDNITYIQSIVGWVKAEDTGASEIVWRYSIVGLAKEYLGEKPSSVENNGTLKLVYHIPDYRLRPFATVYFATSSETVVNVEDGRLELYFRDGQLVGGRLSFSVSSETDVNDPTLGEMKITQNGTWDETFKITSINEKKAVKAPST